jgi:hypothetical protein
MGRPVYDQLEVTMNTAPRRRMSEQEAKAAHLAKMNEVAKCIVDPVPSWLPEVLSDWSFDVRSQDSIDQMWPTRKEMWDSLAGAGNLAIELQNSFRDSAMVGFLMTNSKLESEEYLKHLASQLSKFATFTAEACRSPLLVGKDRKVLGGAGKPLLPGVMPAKYVCAAIISEVIFFFTERGKPPPSKRKSYAAAERLWTAWPLEKKGPRTDPTKGWSRYFAAANDPRLGALRNEVRRHLSIRARDGI